MAITNGAGAAAAESVSEARDIPRSSWRDVLPVHPAAELFPLMSEAELRELGENIKECGLRSPVVLWTPEGTIDKNTPVYLLDGRNRLDAMEMVVGPMGPPVMWLQESIRRFNRRFSNSESRTYYLYGSERNPNARGPAPSDPHAFVLSVNIHRRHLTAEQRRDLIAKVLKAKPDLSNNAIAKQVKADDKTVAKVRTELQANSDIPNKTERTEASGRKARGRKPKAKAESPSQEEKKQEPKASTPPKPVQEVFDSPQAAHAKPDALNLGSLSIAWREVEAHAAAGNKTTLKAALKHLLKETSAALARMRE